METEDTAFPSGADMVSRNTQNVLPTVQIEPAPCPSARIHLASLWLYYVVRMTAYLSSTSLHLSGF